MWPRCASPALGTRAGTCSGHSEAWRGGQELGARHRSQRSPLSNHLGHAGRPTFTHRRDSLAHSSAVNFVLCKEQKAGKSRPFPVVPPPWEKTQDAACSWAAHPHGHVSLTHQPGRRVCAGAGGSAAALTQHGEPTIVCPLLGL